MLQSGLAPSAAITAKPFVSILVEVIYASLCYAILKCFFSTICTLETHKLVLWSCGKLHSSKMCNFLLKNVMTERESKRVDWGWGGEHMLSCPQQNEWWDFHGIKRSCQSAVKVFVDVGDVFTTLLTTALQMVIQCSLWSLCNPLRGSQWLFHSIEKKRKPEINQHAAIWFANCE